MQLHSSHGASGSLPEKETQEILEFTKKYINEPAWAEPLGMVAEDIGAAALKAPEDASAIKA